MVAGVDHAGVIYTATTALPYPHLERATAGLRTELRHQLLAAGELADWSTLEVTGPSEVLDGHGRLWFECRATVGAGGSAQATIRAGVRPAVTVQAATGRQ